jgi:hypothetical protein
MDHGTQTPCRGDRVKRKGYAKMLPHINDHLKYNRLKFIPRAIPPTALKVGEAHEAATKRPAYLCTLV